MSDMDNNVISNIFQQIDNVGANMVAQTYHHLVSHYSAVIFTFTAVYIGFTFIKMMRGHYDANDFILLLIRTVIILTLALNYDYFCLFIYNVFTNEPLVLCQAISVHGGSVEPVSVTHALDNFLNNGKDAAGHIYSMGSWSNPTYLLFGSIIYLLVLVTSGIAAGLIVLAKCASIILFALSPIFIFSALFDSTKSLFESYLRQLMTYALIPIMTCAVLMILLSVTDVATSELTTSQSPNLTVLLPLSLMCVVQMYLLLQVKTKCASLSGGFNLPSVVSAIRQSSSEFASVGRGIASSVGAVKSGASALGNIGKKTTRQRFGRFKQQ